MSFKIHPYPEKHIVWGPNELQVFDTDLPPQAIFISRLAANTAQSSPDSADITPIQINPIPTARQPRTDSALTQLVKSIFNRVRIFLPPFASHTKIAPMN